MNTTTVTEFRVLYDGAEIACTTNEAAVRRLVEARAVPGHDDQLYEVQARVVTTASTEWGDPAAAEAPYPLPTPLPPDYEPGNARRELRALVCPETTRTTSELRGLVDHVAHSADEVADGHVAVVLDWAAELRRREGLTWGAALRAASIFYFG